MFNDLHDHEWGGLPLMDNQAIPAGGVCGAFTVEAARATAAYESRYCKIVQEDHPTAGRTYRVIDKKNGSEVATCATEQDAERAADDYVNSQYSDNWASAPRWNTSSRVTAVEIGYDVLDSEGKPVKKGDKLIEPMDGDGVVLEVFTDNPDGEVYAEWGNGMKTVVWGSEVTVASRRTAGDEDDEEDDSNNDHIRPNNSERCPGCGGRRPIDGNCPKCEMAEETGDYSDFPDFTYQASRRTAITPISRDRYDTSESTSPVEWSEDLLGAVSIPGSGNVVRDTQRPPGAIDTGSWSIGDRVETGNGTGTVDGVYEDRGYALVNMDDGEAVQFPFGWLRKTAISGDVAGEEVSDAREDDARVMQSARLTEADSAYIMAGVATKHGDLGAFVRSASRNPAVYLRQAVYDAHGFMPTVRESMALWQWAAKRVKAEDDPTEQIRRDMVDEFKSNPNERAQLEAQYGQVWDTNALQLDFEVLGFMAPFVVVKRKATGEKGSLMFQSNPRLYFGWAPD